MIELPHKQGSPEWLAARVGIPTASCFDQIVTPVKLEPSASRFKYRAKLLAEWWIRQPLDGEATDFMARGTEMEPEAADWYALVKDAELREAGLCLTDDQRIGCSPDRFVGDDGLLEIKCPALTTQISYILDGPPLGYLCQVQGQLWITGREWCDLLCYHPTLEKVVRRYYRDNAVIDALDKHVGEFAYELESAREKLGERPEPEAAPEPEFDAGQVPAMLS